MTGVHAEGEDDDGPKLLTLHAREEAEYFDCLAGVTGKASLFPGSEQLPQPLTVLGHQLQFLVHLVRSVVRAMVVIHLPCTLHYWVGKSAHLGHPGDAGGVQPGGPGQPNQGLDRLTYLL